MNSPYKYDYSPIFVAAICGLVLVIVMAILLPWSQMTVGMIIGRIVCFILLFAIFLFLGVYGTASGASMYNRKVDHPADPQSLIAGQIYWLNGSYMAKYLGTNFNTGKFRFSIEGVNKPEDPQDSTDMIPVQVRTYLSTIQEVKPE